MSKILTTDNPTDPPNPAAGKSAIYTRSGPPGVAGLYVRPSVGPAVGPLGTGGGGVTDLQTAYDGGNTIAIPLAGGSVTITNPANSNAALSVTHSFTGIGDGIQVTMAGSTLGTGVLSQTSGLGAAITGVSLFTGNALEAYVQDSIGLSVNVGGSGASARGLVVDMAHLTSSGIGAHIIVTSGSARGVVAKMGPTTSGDAFQALMEPSSSGTGFHSQAVGTGRAFLGVVEDFEAFACEVNGVSPGARGLYVELTNPAAAGIGSHVLVQSGTALGQYVQMGIPTTNHAIVVEQKGSGSGVNVGMAATATGVGVLVEQLGSGDALRVKGVTPTTLFSVDALGATSTPSVTFLVPGSANTITVLGRSGVLGEPLNPRIQLPGAVDVGATGRVWHRIYPINGATNLEADPTATSQMPTCFTILNNTLSVQPINLPRADRYHNGDEIRVICVGGDPIDITSAGGAQGVSPLFGAAPGGPFPIGIGTGLRFMSWSPVDGGFGAVWVLLTGVM